MCILSALPPKFVALNAGFEKPWLYCASQLVPGILRFCAAAVLAIEHVTTLGVITLGVTLGILVINPPGGVLAMAKLTLLGILNMSLAFLSSSY